MAISIGSRRRGHEDNRRDFMELAVGKPEAAFVGEGADGAGLTGDFVPQGVEGVPPAGGGEVGEDFGAVGQVHEGAADAGLLEVAVAEFNEPRVLFAALPAGGFEAPERALGGGRIAIMGGEEERRAGGAGAMEFRERGATVGAAGNLHQAVEHEEGAGETIVIHYMTTWAGLEGEVVI